MRSCVLDVRSTMTAVTPRALLASETPSFLNFHPNQLIINPAPEYCIPKSFIKVSYVVKCLKYILEQPMYQNVSESQFTDE